MGTTSAEWAIIGAMLADPRAFDHVGVLTPADFQTPELRAAFATLMQMHVARVRIDLITATNEMPGAELTLTDAIRSYTSTVLTPGHVAVVREASIRRQIAAVAMELHRNAGDQSVDITACLADARQKLADMGGPRMHQWQSGADIALETIAWLEQENVPVPTSGINRLDAFTGGFFPGELTIIGARPGVGKTVLGMLIAIQAAKHNQKAGVLNLEMLPVQYGQRMISNISGLDGMRMRRRDLDADAWAQVRDAANEMSKQQTAYMFTTRYVEDLVNEVNQLDIDLLIVDYLQLLRTKQRIDNERLVIGHISWQLKKLATDKRIPVIALAQLRRPEKGQEGKMPTMSDLRESGNLEADADSIILLHQPQKSSDAYVHPKHKPYFDKWSEQGYRYTCLKVEKQRNGSLGTVAVLFDPTKMRYLGIDV